MSEEFTRLTMKIDDIKDDSCTLEFRCVPCNNILTLHNKCTIECSEYNRLKQIEQEHQILKRDNLLLQQRLAKATSFNINLEQGVTCFGLTIDDVIRLKQIEEEYEELKSDYALLDKLKATDDINFSHMLKSFAIIPRYRYERLKRLEENVNKKLAEYGECSNGKFGKHYQQLIELLESLHG